MLWLFLSTYKRKYLQQNLYGSEEENDYPFYCFGPVVSKKKYGSGLYCAHPRTTLEFAPRRPEPYPWSTNYIFKVTMKIKERFQEEAEQHMHRHTKNSKRHPYGLHQ